MVSRNSMTAEQLVNDVRKHVGYFIEDPFLRVGETDSAHGVLFGQLAEYGNVAVKPFTKLERAQTEQINLRKVAETGLQTIEPLHVAAGGIAAYLVTRRRSDLRHLGQMNWAVNIAASKEELRHVIAPTLGRAASTLASWHNRRIFHGDAQVKNLAYDTTGTSVYIDAEKTQRNPGAEAVTTMTYNDVGLFGLSTLARGLLADRSASYRAGYLIENLVDPYVDKLQQNTRSPIAIDELQTQLNRRWTEASETGWMPRWARHTQQ